MTEYILYVAIACIGPALYPSKDACEAAKAAVVEEFHPRNALGHKIGTVRAICVPRGTGQ